MRWFQKVLTALAITNMVLSPAFASNWTEPEKAQLSQYRDYLEPLGYKLTIDPNSKKALVYDKSTNQLAMEIPFSEESHLRKFSPKTLNKMMLDEMVRVKASSKSAWSHSVRNLPTESAIFFMAMGAVVAGQLITNYSQNPIAMKQHIDHSLSPLGVFGFFTFMYSQGVTSNVLAMYMKNPRYHHMIPYLGMTVGAFLQTYLTQVASDPNVKACAKTMMGYSVSNKELVAGVDQDPCGKAYEYLVVKKKIWEFAPGIVSMLISSGAAGIAQAILTKTVLRVTGVDIALWLVPGTMQLKGARLLLVKGLQIGAFVALDMWFNRRVVSAWKNFFDGAEFHEISENLVTHVNQMKRTQWNTSSKDLENELKNFHSKMMSWRMMNLSEVYEAHQNWSEALQQLTKMFNASQNFYNAFVVELRNSRFQESDLRLLERTYPYFGVQAKGLAEGKEDLYFTNPNFVESMQEETLTDAGIYAEKLLTSEKSKGLYPQEKQKIAEIAEGLKSENSQQKVQALQYLYKNISINYSNVATSSYYRRFLSAIAKTIGNPRPMMEPGRGFLATYEQSPFYAESLKEVKFSKNVGAYQTPRITDYLLMQMICGPDVEKGETTIKTTNGFPSIFMPPTIRNVNDEFQVCGSLGGGMLTTDAIYRTQIKAKGKKPYVGAISYLINEARPSVVGSQSEAQFENWWKKNTESQMQSAFEKYGKEYDNIVAKMIETIYRKDRSIMNRGPVANGTMLAAFQEQRVYLSLLQELLQPSSQYTLDINNIMKGSVKNESLKEIENQFSILNGLIQQIKVSDKDGRKVISSSLENYQLEEQLTNIQTALKKVSSDLGVGDSPVGAKVQLNKQQRDLAVSCLEHLQSIASEVMMYGTMANAVSWEKIRNLKRLNMEQEQFNNDLQAKLAAMRGLSMGAKP